MARQPIPDDQQPTWDVAHQMRKELDDLRAANGPRKQAEVKQVTPAIADNTFQLK